MSWPLHALRLRSADLLLRPCTEADLPALVAALPDDLELDPSLPLPDRDLALQQMYWRSFGAWSPDSWRLGFLVLRGDELVGFQELEGQDFPLLRTVDTSSWLIAAVRGQGVGKAMRRAALGFAFGSLGAEAAVTSAWRDNAASLGVSRAVGYTENGISRERRGDAVGEMVHLRMTRRQWTEFEVEVTGFEECRHLFGV